MENFTIDEELKAHLTKTDAHFRELAEKHSEYDRLLRALEARGHLTADEELEEVRLKKLKLRAKDEMSGMLGQHRAGRGQYPPAGAATAGASPAPLKS
jgi:uncharacterized protein YdcH (DUF465 family)